MVCDIGMVCGELKYAFLCRTGNPVGSEMYIRYFIKTYASNDKNRERVFVKITQRMPYYMVMTERRIPRNEYLDWDYHKRLSFEALECLKMGA